MWYVISLKELIDQHMSMVEIEMSIPSSLVFSGKLSWSSWNLCHTDIGM